MNSEKVNLELKTETTNYFPPGEIPGKSLTIDLWCNAVAGGWDASDLEGVLGGSEECLVLWASALARRGHRVRVFHNMRLSPGKKEFGGATFLPHWDFDPYEMRDVLISWKCSHPWRVGAVAKTRIHWSSNIEPCWPKEWIDKLDLFIALTPYHLEAMPWLEKYRAIVVPHGIDLAHLETQKTDKIPGRAIYSSSPDRGLATLLKDWPLLKAQYPELNLHVYYGWRQFMACGVGNPAAHRFRKELEELLQQPGITYRGAVTRDEIARAYWEAEYWMLPLNRAASELFCLNAVKAHHCGALGIVNRIGALQNTVTSWIDYDSFLKGDRAVCRAKDFGPLAWDNIVSKYWEPLFKDLKCKS